MNYTEAKWPDKYPPLPLGWKILKGYNDQERVHFIATLDGQTVYESCDRFAIRRWVLKKAGEM